MKGVVVAAALLALVACSGGPAARPAPDWVFTPPQPDAGNFYFTGAGTSKEGDQAQAEQTARGAVIDDIMRYIGVKVTSQTTATARASVDSFKSDILQTVTQTGSGRLSGLQVADMYVEKRSGAVTVYLLARFDKTALAKEKKRIEDLFAEQEQAVSGPEAEARSLEAGGDYFAAAVKFLEAATAAATSGLDNARIKFERNLNEAKDALDHIAILKVNDNLTTSVGTPFADPFTARVVAGSTSKDPGIAEVPLTVSYTEVNQDRKQVRRASLKTDGKGNAAFTFPAPSFVGSDKVTMTLDLGASLDALDNLPKDFANEAGGLEDVAAAKRVVFNFTTFSNARGIDTGIAVVALDASGNPLSSGEFASGILTSLSGAGFTVKPLTLDASSIVGKADADIIAAAASGGGSRAIYGTAQVIGTQMDSGSVFAKVSATVTVADLKAGVTLLTVTKSKSAIGKTESAAISAALQQLGQDVGQDIANKLR